MCRLAQDLEDLSGEVGYLSLKVEMEEERQGRMQIRKLAVKKAGSGKVAGYVCLFAYFVYLKSISSRVSLPLFSSGHAVTAPAKPVKPPAAYSRRPIDYAALDAVGLGGYKEPRASSVRPRSSSVRSMDGFDQSLG